MRDLLTTRNQNCWKELIEKETLTRMHWKLKYKQEHPQRHVEATRRRRELSIPQAGTSFLPPINVPKKPELKVLEESSNNQSDGQYEAEMRAATPLTSSILYDGFSKEGKGRSLYLKKRKQFSPEEKFPHPIVSSWDYGWRLGDVVKEFNVPIHGRSKIVRDTFYSKNGVISQPQYTDKLL
ncbi:protein SPMIP1 [Rhinophrynus dorsalis]